MLILVDGHRIGTGNAAKLNVDRIERIEVTKGPASALYGSAAMGGVINLITKKGDGDPSAILSGDYGSFDYYKGQISSGGEVNDRFRKSHGYADLEYNGDFFGTKVHWRGLGYYLWDRNHWKYGSPDPDDRQSKYTDSTLGTDQQFSWHMVSWNTLVLGFNLEKLEKESEAVSGGQPSAPYTPGMEYNTRSYFLQDALDLWDNRIDIVGAVRYDRFDVKTRRPETGDFPEFNEKSEIYDHTSPKLCMGIKFFDELLRGRANVGEGFKSPSADQLSAQYTTHNNRIYVGNPDLDPETSLTYDIGFDIFHSFFKFKAKYFHTDYEDKIVQTSSTSGI